MDKTVVLFGNQFRNICNRWCDPSGAYEIGEQVRVDIPDETDPDFQYLGQNREIISVIRDVASSVTGEPQNDDPFRVKLDVGETVNVRARNLRRPI